MMITNEEAARSWLLARDECDTLAFGRLTRFAELLIEENENQNLIARSSVSQLWQRHMVDSAQLLDFVPRETTGTWLDLGTGAGFPGLVAAILRKDIEFVLLEVRSKRIQWLNFVISELALANVSVAGMRLADMTPCSFDIVSARAFASLPNLISQAAHLSAPRTTWLLPKGRGGVIELLSLTGWTHTFHVEQSITDPNSTIIVGELISDERSAK